MKYHDQWSKQGDQILVRCLSSGDVEPKKWIGFARFETIGSWKAQGWTIGMLDHCSAYTEGEKDNVYRLGDHRHIAVMKKDNEFRVMTRAARGQEKLVHDRWPIITYRDPSKFKAHADG